MWGIYRSHDFQCHVRLFQALSELNGFINSPVDSTILDAITMNQSLRPNRSLVGLASSSTSMPLPFRIRSAQLVLQLRRQLQQQSCYYATHNELGRDAHQKMQPKRRNVTVLSDDGRIRWSDLSAREKLARTTQQSVNFVVVLAGVVLTVS